MNGRENSFFEQTDEDQHQANLDGLRITNEHLNESFKNPNLNENTKKRLRNIGIKRKLNPNTSSDMKQSPTAKTKFNNNSSLCLPFESDNFDEMQKCLDDNLKQLN